MRSHRSCHMRKRKIPCDICDSSPSLNKVDDSNTPVQRTTRYMRLGTHTLRRSAFPAPALREPFNGAILVLPAPLSVYSPIKNCFHKIYQKTLTISCEYKFQIQIIYILSYYPCFVNHISVFIFAFIEKYHIKAACILVKLFILTLEIYSLLCYNSIRYLQICFGEKSIARRDCADTDILCW